MKRVTVPHAAAAVPHAAAAACWPQWPKTHRADSGCDRSVGQGLKEEEDVRGEDGTLRERRSWKPLPRQRGEAVPSASDEKPGDAHRCSVHDAPRNGCVLLDELGKVVEAARCGRVGVAQRRV